jgi:hypothetical protein
VAYPPGNYRVHSIAGRAARAGILRGAALEPVHVVAVRQRVFNPRYAHGDWPCTVTRPSHLTRLNSTHHRGRDDQPAQSDGALRRRVGEHQHRATHIDDALECQLPAPPDVAVRGQGVGRGHERRNDPGDADSSCRRAGAGMLCLSLHRFIHDEKLWLTWMFLHVGPGPEHPFQRRQDAGGNCRQGGRVHARQHDQAVSSGAAAGRG